MSHHVRTYLNRISITSKHIQSYLIVSNHSFRPTADIEDLHAAFAPAAGPRHAALVQALRRDDALPAALGVPSTADGMRFELGSGSGSGGSGGAGLRSVKLDAVHVANSGGVVAAAFAYPRAQARHGAASLTLPRASLGERAVFVTLLAEPRTGELYTFGVWVRPPTCTPREPACNPRVPTGHPHLRVFSASAVHLRARWEAAHGQGRTTDHPLRPTVQLHGSAVRGPLRGPVRNSRERSSGRPCRGAPR